MRFSEYIVKKFKDPSGNNFNKIIEPLNNIIKNTVDILFIINRKGEIIYKNDFLIYENKKFEIFYDIIVDEQKPDVIKTIKNVFETGKISSLKLYFKNLDTKLFEAKVIPNELDINAETVFIICTEITKRKADEVAKAKEIFLANISHEIRNPMNVIMGMAELLNKTDLSDEQLNYLEVIIKSSENLLVVINDILDITKIEVGKLDFQKISFRVIEVISSIINITSFSAKEKKIEILSDYPSEIENLIIFGDPARLNQILLNIFNSAIKFTYNGKIEIILDILEESERTINIKFTVNDTGTGIPQENLNYIFNSFLETDTNITRKYGNIGLGLSISSKLIELMGGSLLVDSRLNKGTSFSFNLTFVKGSASDLIELDDAAIKETIEEISLEEVKILLVEDHEFGQLLVKRIVKNWNCVMHIANNGEEAIKKL